MFSCWGLPGVEQSTLAGEVTRASLIRVDLPVLKVCVVLGTTCTRESWTEVLAVSGTNCERDLC